MDLHESLVRLARAEPSLRRHLIPLPRIPRTASVEYRENGVNVNLMILSTKHFTTGTSMRGIQDGMQRFAADIKEAFEILNKSVGPFEISMDPDRMSVEGLMRGGLALRTYARIEFEKPPDSDILYSAIRAAFKKVGIPV